MSDRSKIEWTRDADGKAGATSLGTAAGRRRDVDGTPRQAAAGQDGSAPDTVAAGPCGSFLVLRNQSARHTGCDYFVLDLTQDRQVAHALGPYAASCAREKPELAADLHRLLDLRAERELAVPAGHRHGLTGSGFLGGSR